MNKKGFITALSLFGVVIVSCQNPERVKSWQSDIDFLLSQIKKEHYVYKSKALPAELSTAAEKLKTHVADYSDERMLIELEQLMYFVGDGHSYILPAAAKITHPYFLPLHFYWFSDGMFIINADTLYQSLIGKKVIEVGSLLPEKFMHDMKTYISQDNEVGALWIGPFFLRFRGMLERYGLGRGAESIILKVEDESGRKSTETVSFIPVPRLRGIPKLIAPRTSEAPLYLTNLQDNYWLKELQGKTLYVQFNQVMDATSQPIREFALHLDSLLRKNSFEKLIVDVRHNNGGNANLTPPLIDALKDFERINPNGRLILITGRNTFSAAQIFIARVDKETHALFAGEPSSSSPNFVGEENYVELPWSGAAGSISNRYHESIPGDTRKWIEPDIKISLSSKDYFAGRDPVLDSLLKIK